MNFIACCGTDMQTSRKVNQDAVSIKPGKFMEQTVIWRLYVTGWEAARENMPAVV